MFLWSMWFIFFQTETLPIKVISPKGDEAYLWLSRHHVPDGSYFPYFPFGNNKKTAPHFSQSAICILYFVSAINKSSVWVEHPYIFNPECPGPGLLAELFSMPWIAAAIPVRHSPVETS